MDHRVILPNRCHPAHHSDIAREGEEAKGAPKFPQEGAKPDCDEWPNPCEPE